MLISTKVKFYAVFQFVTFISYFILGIIFVLLIPNSSEINKQINNYQQDNFSFFSKATILIYSFKISSPIGIAVSILTYINTILVFSSWIIGLQIVRSKNRNLLDSLFLLFVFVPLISNILCLIAQVSSNTIAISYNINKQKEFKIQYEKVKESKTAKLKEIKLELQKLKQK